MLDIGCGAGRNAVPIAAGGWNVLGVDLSRPMLAAAAARARNEQVADRCRVALGSMDHLPVAPRSCQLIVAHGIWNLARSAEEFRRGVHEAAGAAAVGAALFVFTFSRSTLADTAQPVAGESFIFANLAGERQVFVTGGQLLSELAAAGFVPDPALPLREINPRKPGCLVAAGSPVIWEGAFRFTSTR